MEVLAKLAVISNAFLIAFTSDFIQKLVYKFHYGEVGLEIIQNKINFRQVGTMAGYMNFTLSRAPNENWVDEGGPDCFYRSNCQELFYESLCFCFYRSNLKKNFTKASLKAINTNIFISEGSVTTKGISHLYTGNYWKESDLCQILNQTIRHIFALRLLFVIVFEHFVFGVCKMIDFGVPDIPESLDIKVGNIFVD